MHPAILKSETKRVKGEPHLEADEIVAARKKIVPPNQRFQGYARSGAMFFNNLASSDTNAPNNN